MKKSITLLISGCLCFCLSCFSFGETAKAIANGSISKARLSSSETWEPEMMFGDWSGTTKGDATIYAYSPDCFLSINSDRTWACYVNREWQQGTWEVDSDREKTLALSVRQGKKYPADEWFFGDTRKGFRFYAEEGAYLAMEYSMSEMDEEPADTLYGDWYGEAPSPDPDRTLAASVSVNSDGTWSSATHFTGKGGDPFGQSAAEGDISYESEYGHLVFFDESEGGIVKKENGRLCFETYEYMEFYGDEPVEFHVDPDAREDDDVAAETDDVAAETNDPAAETDYLASETDNPASETDNPAAETDDAWQSPDPYSDDEAWQTEEVIGDWLGETDTDADSGALRRGAVLSLNSDHTWVSCAAGEWHSGTWEVSPEDGSRIILTTVVEKIEPTSDWFFEKSPDGYIYSEEDAFGVREFRMNKMKDETPDQLCGSWYGEKHYPPSDRPEEHGYERSYAAFLSIDADHLWMSVIGFLEEDREGIVSGSGVSGKPRYVSESGHIFYLGKNRGGLIKRPDGKYRFETYSFVDKYGRGPFTFFVDPYRK